MRLRNSLIPLVFLVILFRPQFTAISAPPATSAPAVIDSPTRYSPAGLRAAAKHPLAAEFVAARKAWLARWNGGLAKDCKTAVSRAAAAAEYQALTGDTRHERYLLDECRSIVAAWPGKLDDYAIFITNPEPAAVTLARTAALNSKAREILSPLLTSLLKTVHDGIPGMNAFFGKSTLCRVRIQQALGLPCDPMADYGKNLGLRYMLAHTSNGFRHWETGSPWYQIFNDVMVSIGWDIRREMTDAERSAFGACYFFPFYFQLAGKSPYIGEDRDKLEKERAGGPKWKKSYSLWSGYPSQWRGTDPISTYMRWRALHDLGLERHFDDLFCPPTPKLCPSRPPLPAYSDFSPFVRIMRGPNSETIYVDGNEPSLSAFHKGSGTPWHETIEVPK